jgi:hypothetical protein
MSLLVAVTPPRKLVQHVLKVGGQGCNELHAASVAGVQKHKPRCVEEWAFQALHSPDVPRYATVDASVKGITDDGMADGAQVYSNLMSASGLNGDLAQRQAR